MKKLNIYQRNRINSIQYEVDDETIELVVHSEGSVTKSKNELKLLGHITAATREADTREQVFSQRDTGLMLTMFMLAMFSPIYIAGSNDIKALDIVGAIVFILGIVGLVYFIIASSISKVRKKYFYFSEGGLLSFYYRNQTEIDEVEEFVSELNKVLKQLSAEPKQE